MVVSVWVVYLPDHVAAGSCNSMLLPSFRRQHHSAYCWDHVKIKIQNLISISLNECAFISHCHNFTPSKNSKLNRCKSGTSVIIQYADFSDWFISLSNTYLKFPPCLFMLDSLFLFSTAKDSIVWMYHGLFIHSFPKGHLGCF